MNDYNEKITLAAFPDGNPQVTLYRKGEEFYLQYGNRTPDLARLKNGVFEILVKDKWQNCGFSTVIYPPKNQEVKTNHENGTNTR